MQTLQHAKPLWIGLLYSVLIPSLLALLPWEILCAGMMRNSAWFAMVVSKWALPVSLLATYVFGLPYILLLRRFKRLNFIYVFKGGITIGVLVALSFSLSIVMLQVGDLDNMGNMFTSPERALWVLDRVVHMMSKAVIPGALLGVLSGMAFCFGSGIPISFRPIPFSQTSLPS